MKTILWSMLGLLLLAGPVLAQTEHQEASESQEEHESKYVRTPPAHYAQWLVDDMVVTHVAVKAGEMAVVLDDTCRTIAATDKEEVGELCGGDELEVISEQKPEVETPTKDEPVYEVTLPLHDAEGNLLGTLAMELDTKDLNRETALALAQKVLHELEAEIPSKKSLF